MATIIPSTTRKRSLDEVVSPEFVAREDEGGAYGALEMPKRIMLECVADKGRCIDERILALEAENARSNRVLMRLKAVIRSIHAQDAARAAAAAAAPT